MVIFAPLLSTVLDRRPLKLFYAAVLAALQLFIIALSIFVRAAYAAYCSSDCTELPALLILEAVQFGAAAIALLLCLLVIRRPEVYLRGHAVDRQYTTSLGGRWTFSWVNGLLSYAKANHGLDLGDLPILHLGARSEQLHKQFMEMKKRDRLWKTLVRAHYSEVLFQMVLTVLQAATQFLPTFVLYKFLELLEQSSKTESTNATAWAWIFTLGLSLILASSVETWLYWIVCECDTSVR